MKTHTLRHRSLGGGAYQRSSPDGLQPAASNGCTALRTLGFDCPLRLSVLTSMLRAPHGCKSRCMQHRRLPKEQSHHPEYVESIKQTRLRPSPARSLTPHLIQPRSPHTNARFARRHLHHVADGHTRTSNMGLYRSRSTQAPHACWQAFCQRYHGWFL